ncbi:Mediator complex, subunit Med13 [Penicillium expansum]|uniref:Mediator of RNA polymerase II transcription subunit 13 n=1 Tax=Penicillium expansum TaxID=27334 RepID=A0A0A2JR43_PENEN|nr:Mediator complex, subunit Med13 [Penicillium expansum]KGO42997.1 Mediator complex, subunit Med13 [Penicillium expansum]KGO57118.1 Mediator complex, subunit Med13 [Penicillium expansum]KGO68679.1 Mediator complex, subunit Med13 [Penicillium expansum]
MDFPGGANTNIHLVDGFSNIYWRIYTEEAGIANNPQESPANGYTILKHLSRLKDLEARLRGLNCLASCPRRLGLWVFSPTPEFESLNPLYVRGNDAESNRIVVGTTTLKVSALGSVSSLDLVKGLSSDNQSQLGTQPAGQPRPNQSQPSSRRQDGYSSSAAIYASFISAVAGSIGLQLIRRHAALPLGSRTLFTAVESSGYESPHINNESILSTSCLTTLNIQLTMSGTITVSAQTVSQTGIMRLCSPCEDIAEIIDVQPGTDLWLCPNGTIARLVTANVNSPTVPSLGYPPPGNLSAKRIQWKLDVVQWLRNFGLHVDTIDEEPWVEVEVWEPFFARLAGEAWRQSDDSQSALPLKRMLWPARFCFRRASSSNISSEAQTSLLDEPLDFAERWSTMASSLKLDHIAYTAQNTPITQDPQSKDHEMMSPPKAEPLESIESLSRIAQYPDLQSTNLVYPTPPDGAAAVGLNNPNPSEAFADDSDFGIPHAMQRSSRRNAPGSDISPVQNSGVGIGTGRYDASDEEDLFGEMNERDFGSKGITDADFSFFDDPDFDGMEGDSRVEDADEAHEASHPQSESEAEAMLDAEPSPNQPPGIPTHVEAHEVHASFIQSEAPRLSEEPVAPEEPVHSPMDRAGQTISPPLSPVEVKKILFPGPEADNHQNSTDNRGQGHYHPVAFPKLLGDWDQKYGAAGKFWFSSGGSLDTLNHTSDIPTIGIPHRARSSANALGSSKEHNTTSLSLIQSENSLRSASVSSDSSDDSIEIISEHVPTPAAMPTMPSLKRKRASSESDIISVTSQEKSLPGTETSPAYAAENSTFLGNFLANFSDWTLTGYFSTFPPQQHPVLFRREGQLEIAQLLVDQITQSSLKHPLDEKIGLFDLESESLSLQALDTTLLGETSKLDFKRYTSLHDEFVANQPQQQPQQQPPPPKDSPKSFILKLSAPHIRVRRGKEYLEALPPAVSFWETFGLEPAHGPKNISAYCIHPQAASKAADVFLNRFGLLYQSCSLGTHARGDDSVAFEDGLKPWKSETSSYESMMQVLKRTCEQLGSELSQSPATTDNHVVYIINPFTHAAALADICSAFWHLFQQLVAGSERRQTRISNELVLQIIPLEFIMSSEAMVVPPQTDYLNLALEVYSRCRPNDVDMSPLLCAPPILLADALPRAISFRLAPERSSPLQDGRSLHIAYSKSLDQRWISVAWSDLPGSIQRTMSYCLRYRQSGGARPISEIRNEIWATTKHIMDKFQARWKVQLATTEPIETDEVEAWASLADHHNKLKPGSLELTILAVNTVPDLILEPPVPPISMAMLNILSSSTPVSTPNPSASVASPEQSGNAATPTSAGPAAYSAPTPTETSLETDSEAVLTDICDDSWLAILSHRLNSSPHLTEFRPALSSGYLLRRKGATDGDGVFSITVNLIYSPRPPASHDNVLKDTLSMYRDLSCLARAKGICSVQNNTLPWHVATALRGQELLSYVF